MADYWKISNIFQLATEPENANDASVHLGGWTENVWSNLGAPGDFSAALTNLARRRAYMLPSSGKIIGQRWSKYTVIKNVLIPGQSGSRRVSIAGLALNVTDLPQVALYLRSTTASANSSNITLRGFPDDYMKGGEYAPTPALTTNLRSFITALSSGPFGFLGRDKTQASVRIQSASSTDGIRLMALPATGLDVGDFVRLNRVFDTLTGKPITGSYEVATIIGTVITVRGWPSGMVVSKPTGTLRRDQIAYVQYTGAEVARAVVKKVGSPFEKYRGRRSKRARV